MGAFASAVATSWEAFRPGSVAAVAVHDLGQIGPVKPPGQVDGVRRGTLPVLPRTPRPGRPRRSGPGGAHKCTIGRSFVLGQQGVRSRRRSPPSAFGERSHDPLVDDVGRTARWPTRSGWPSSGATASSQFVPAASPPIWRMTAVWRSRRRRRRPPSAPGRTVGRNGGRAAAPACRAAGRRPGAKASRAGRGRCAPRSGRRRPPMIASIGAHGCASVPVCQFGGEGRVPARAGPASAQDGRAVRGWA